MHANALTITKFYTAPGSLLGWSPFLRGKVRQQAAGNLQKFMASRKPS